MLYVNVITTIIMLCPLGFLPPYILNLYLQHETHRLSKLSISKDISRMKMII